MNGDREKIGAWDLMRVLARAFLIQASWSFDRMQTLGFAYAMLPVLNKLYPDGAERASRLNLHMEYFNTQPYFASFILGAAARLEQDRAAGRNASADVSGLKAALMAPLGALGDSFFWGALKPFAASVAVALLMAGAWWAPLLFLVLYNICHVALRAGLVFLGYKSAGNVVALVERYNFTDMARLFKAISLSVLGGAMGAISLWQWEFSPQFHFSASLTTATGLAVTLVLIAVLRRGLSPVKLMIGLAAICLALAYGGVV